MIYGFILVGVGVVLATIGGFIAMIRNPAAFNEQSRANFDPVRKNISRDAVDAFGKAQWHDAKAKWFTRIGITMGLAGMLLLTIFADRTNTENGQAKISINNHLAISAKERQ